MVEGIGGNLGMGNSTLNSLNLVMWDPAPLIHFLAQNPSSLAATGICPVL
jgi:hypothetical protein